MFLVDFTNEWETHMMHSDQRSFSAFIILLCPIQEILDIKESLKFWKFQIICFDKKFHQKQFFKVVTVEFVNTDEIFGVCLQDRQTDRQHT